MVTVYEPKFQILLQRNSHNNRLADTYRNANVWYLCNLRALICFMEHIAADIKCIYKSNLIMSHARPIKVSEVVDPMQVQMPLWRTIYQLPSTSSRSSVASRQSAIPAHFRFHIIIIHALSLVRFGRGMPLYNSFAKRIQKCWWDYYMLGLRLQVEYLNVRAGLYLFNAVDCFVFSVSLPFRL